MRLETTDTGAVRWKCHAAMGAVRANAPALAPIPRLRDRTIRRVRRRATDGEASETRSSRRTTRLPRRRPENPAKES
jgi:hypothetical protein